MRLRAWNLVVVENSGEGAMKKILAVFALLISISVATSSVAISGATPFIKFDWERAVSLYKQGQFREAIAEFRKVLEEAPDHPDSWKFIGLSYYQIKDYKSAIQPLEKALELKRKDNRNDPDLYRALGQSHMLIKDYDKALPYFETLVRIQMNVGSVSKSGQTRPEGRRFVVLPGRRPLPRRQAERGHRGAANRRSRRPCERGNARTPGRIPAAAGRERE
jgi:tetratricopeptide (TPR) repeat protein